jgi:DNA-directed RNA polymerase subunit RPC12/RpoP
VEVLVRDRSLSVRHVLAFVVLTFLARDVDNRAYAQAAPKNPRVLCGCPSARLLVDKHPPPEGVPELAAWLYDGAHVEGFAQEGASLTSSGALLSVEPFAVAGIPQPDLVRVRAASDDDSFVLGLLKPHEKQPRDTARIAARKAHPVVDHGPPVLKAAWLAPLEQRERTGCGTQLTQLLAFEAAPGSPPVAAWIVTRDGTSTVVDERFASAFGLGRIDVCAQGMELSPSDNTIEVRPVSAQFVVGEPWRFSSSGTDDPKLLAMPASADSTRAHDPFPRPNVDDGHPLRLKVIVTELMGLIFAFVVVAALVVFVVLPRRRRRMREVVCTSCGKAVPIDELDPKTDGYFCPACGGSVIQKSGVTS